MNAVAEADAAVQKETECPKARDDKCARYTSVAAGESPISLTIVRPKPYPAPATNCSIGVCYRLAMPYRFRVDFERSGYSVEEVHSLTNGMPPIPIDFDRAIFVTKATRIDFDTGMLNKVHVVKPSEGLELASLPVRVVKAFFGAVAELIQLRVNVGTQQQLLAAKELEVLKAEQALKEAKRQQKVTELAAQANTALLIARSDGQNPERALPGFAKAVSASQSPPATPPT